MTGTNITPGEVRMLTQDDGTTLALEQEAEALVPPNPLDDVCAGDTVELRDGTGQAMRFTVFARTQSLIQCGPFTMDARTGRGLNQTGITIHPVPRGA